MTHHTSITHHPKRAARLGTVRYGLAALLIGGAFGINVVIAAAQEKTNAKTPVTRRSNESGRDPFKKYEPPRVVAKRSGQVMPPSIQERIAQYKAQKVASMNARMPAPKPTTALLLSELQVVGISRTPRGYAAIVEAVPIKLSYVVYPGERFYDGQLVAIEDNRLIFRHETVFENGKRERSVDIKPLRQVNVAEGLTTVRAQPVSATASESEKKSEEKASASDKP
jgi:hypothetical protein